MDLGTSSMTLGCLVSIWVSVMNIRASGVDSGASGVNQSISTDLGYPWRSGVSGVTRLQQVPDVQVASHSIGDALLEAEPDVASAHRSAHALLDRVRLRGCVLCGGHRVGPLPDASPPSTAPTTTHLRSGLLLS